MLSSSQLYMNQLRSAFQLLFCSLAPAVQLSASVSAASNPTAILSRNNPIQFISNEPLKSMFLIIPAYLRRVKNSLKSLKRFSWIMLINCWNVNTLFSSLGGLFVRYPPICWRPVPKTSPTVWDKNMCCFSVINWIIRDTVILLLKRQLTEA